MSNLLFVDGQQGINDITNIKKTFDIRRFNVFSFKFCSCNIWSLDIFRFNIFSFNVFSFKISGFNAFQNVNRSDERRARVVSASEGDKGRRSFFDFRIFVAQWRLEPCPEQIFEAAEMFRLSVRPRGRYSVSEVIWQKFCGDAS